MQISASRRNSIPVLTKDKPGATHKGYLWVYRDVIDKLILLNIKKPVPGKDLRKS